MSEADELDEDDGPLRSIRVPVEWPAYDDEGRVLRLFASSNSLAEVVVSEGLDVVSISLFERAVVGVYPDGSIAAGDAAGVIGCLEVELRRPLGGRTLIDGTTGQTPHLRDREARAAEMDWHRARALNGGCPRWIP